MLSSQYEPSQAELHQYVLVDDLEYLHEVTILMSYNNSAKVSLNTGRLMVRLVSRREDRRKRKLSKP